MSNTKDVEDKKTKLNMEQREEVLAEVEALMFQGMHKSIDIAKAIKCSVPTATSYKKAIQTRWRSSKDCDYDITRIEIMGCLHEIEKASLLLLNQPGDNNNAKVGAINSLIEVQKSKMFLCGITKVMNKDT